MVDGVSVRETSLPVDLGRRATLQREDRRSKVPGVKPADADKRCYLAMSDLVVWVAGPPGRALLPQPADPAARPDARRV